MKKDPFDVTPSTNRAQANQPRPNALYWTFINILVVIFGILLLFSYQLGLLF